MRAGAVFLGIDTSTRRTAVAVSEVGGAVLAASSVQGTSGDVVLDGIDRVLRDAGAEGPRDIGGIGVGLGPGSFTGLRIGLAAVKVLAYTLDVPIVGVATPEALALAASRSEPGLVRSGLTIVLPAGASDRYVATIAWDADRPRLSEAPRLVVPAAVAGADPDAAGAPVIALDLRPDEVGPDALERGARASEQLAASILTLALDDLRAGRGSDVSTLVPTYVALPRGVLRAAEEMVWSPDPR